MTKPKVGEATVNLVCPRPMKKWLRQQAAEQEISVSELLRRLVAESMARHPTAR